MVDQSEGMQRLEIGGAQQFAANTTHSTHHLHPPLFLSCLVPAPSRSVACLCYLAQPRSRHVVQLDLLDARISGRAIVANDILIFVPVFYLFHHFPDWLFDGPTVVPAPPRRKRKNKRGTAMVRAVGATALGATDKSRSEWTATEKSAIRRYAKERRKLWNEVTFKEVTASSGGIAG